MSNLLCMLVSGIAFIWYAQNQTLLWANLKGIGIKQNKSVWYRPLISSTETQQSILMIYLISISHKYQMN